MFIFHFNIYFCPIALRYYDIKTMLRYFTISDILKHILMEISNSICI